MCTYVKYRPAMKAAFSQENILVDRGEERSLASHDITLTAMHETNSPVSPNFPSLWGQGLEESL